MVRAMGAAIVAAAGLLGSCATQDELAAPLGQAPASYRNQSSGPVLERPAADWWRSLGSAELNSLEESALANNRDLQVAVARVAQANAQAGIANAARYPTVDLVARRDVRGPEDGVGTAKSSADWNTRNTVQVGVRASYEVDLWGRYGYAADSALALAKASEFQRETVALTLTADVAATYIEYLSLQDRIQVTRRSLENRRNSLRAVTRRLEKGEGTSLEASQQKVAVATAESNIAGLEQRRERAFNRLATLTGTTPSELRVSATSLRGLTIPGVATGTPGELVCRRPDIRKAEAELAAAQLDVKAVRAQMLPVVALTADMGYGALSSSLLFGPGSAFIVAAASATQAVFDGGKRASQVELSRARATELVHQYSSTLLTAVREVEDASATARLTESQRRALVEASDAAQAAYRLSLKSFEIGGIDYFVVLDTEEKLVASEDAAEGALHDRMRAAVDLYRAVGAGLRPADTQDCGT